MVSCRGGLISQVVSCRGGLIKQGPLYLNVEGSQFCFKGGGGVSRGGVQIPGPPLICPCGGGGGCRSLDLH